MRNLAIRVSIFFMFYPVSSFVLRKLSSWLSSEEESFLIYNILFELFLVDSSIVLETPLWTRLWRWPANNKTSSNAHVRASASGLRFVIAGFDATPEVTSVGGRHGDMPASSSWRSHRSSTNSRQNSCRSQYILDAFNIMPFPKHPPSSFLFVGLAFAAGTAVGSIALHVYSRRRAINKGTSLEKARAHLWKIVEYSFTGALLYSGDKLHLYDTLTDAGPITAEELAKHTGFSERWLFEFFAQATAAGFCEYDTNGKFKLKPEYSLLLQSPERSRDSLAGLMQALNALVSRANATAHSIQTGIGVDYDYHIDSHRGKDDVIQGIDRKNRNWFQNHLVKDVIERVTVPATNKHLVQVLERGANVADVGCGCGSSTIALATSFPNSHIFAYELSPESLRVMRERIQQLKLQNVTVCDVKERGMEEGPEFDFVYAHDLLHDMTNPRALIRQVRQRLSETGCWVIVDVDCHGSLQDNLTKTHSSAATFLGFSCLLCLASSTSEAGGEGLGTLGFHKELAQKWMKEAGFAHFETMTIKSLPTNSCFIVG